MDKGKKRENNEDNLYFNGIFLAEGTQERPIQLKTEFSGGFQLYAVCDGMGGEQLGETASLIAVQTLSQYAPVLKATSSKKLSGALARCLVEANGKICEARKTTGSRRIGTTLALLALNGKTALLYNIGDSRIYLLRGKKLRQLSEDHTALSQSVKYGILTPEQAKNHPRRNSLTQHLGIEIDEMVIEPYQAHLKTRRGDRFLLCSDGLTSELEDSEIAAILARNEPDEAVTQLVNLALARGGRDNVTVIVIRTE